MMLIISVSTLVDEFQTRDKNGKKSKIWYGRDDNGNKLANGIYTYKIKLTDSLNKESTQVEQTVSIFSSGTEITNMTNIESF